MKREVLFDSEAALCESFNAWARGQGWIPYNETEGWDILLVHPDGTQIGVQAKLRFNMVVLEQAIESRWSYWNGAGPDFRAVLVPDHGGREVCAALGLMMFFPTMRYRAPKMDFQPPIGFRMSPESWFYWSPDTRHKLPDYVPDVPAGTPAPSQLTHWKVSALRICAVLELRGHVTKRDFARYHIDHRRWLTTGWLVAHTTDGAWRAGGGIPRFPEQHPVVYPKILQEVRDELVELRMVPA
jgi:hypothetical protein